jgi:DNA-binding transcriptional ArsR family regulator
MQERTPSTLRPGNAAPVFAALGDPVRLAILDRLSGGGPLPTVRLQRGRNLSRQAITKHLRVLERAGLVCSRRSGRDRLWQLQERQLLRTREYLEQRSAQWDARLVRLRSMVEGG